MEFLFEIFDFSKMAGKDLLGLGPYCIIVFALVSFGSQILEYA